MVRVSSFAASRASTAEASLTHSASSSSTRGISPPPRFCAVSLRQRLNARFRVIFARNSRSTLGRVGGMDRQAFRYVSLTVSSASASLHRMRFARLKQ